MSIRDRVRTKRVIVPTVAALALVGIGGTAWAVMDDRNDRLSSDQRSSASDAALDEVGGGRVLEVDVDDDTDEGGPRVYEVEVVDADGQRWDITLDDDYAVLVVDRDGDDRYDDRAGSGAAATPTGSAGGNVGTGSAGGTGDAQRPAGDTTTDLYGQTVDEDAPLTQDERAQVVAAAEAAVEGGGTATDVDRSDDPGEGYEVEVVDGTNQDWDVTLAPDLTVLSAVRD
ncbi:MAG TPA: PepSY domain-containing protein [Nocardioides sp.]